MIQVKVGAVTTDIEAPRLENALGTISRLPLSLYQLQCSVNDLTDAVRGVPRVVFQIGPIREQSSAD